MHFGKEEVVLGKMAKIPRTKYGTDEIFRYYENEMRKNCVCCDSLTYTNTTYTDTERTHELLYSALLVKASHRSEMP